MKVTSTPELNGKFAKKVNIGHTNQMFEKDRRKRGVCFITTELKLGAGTHASFYVKRCFH